MRVSLACILSACWVGPALSFGNLVATSSSPYDILRNIQVESAETGEVKPLTAMLQPEGKTVVAFLTHFGDFNSWEYAEQLNHYASRIDDAGVGLVTVGMGSPEAAKTFARELGYPLSRIVLDREAAAYKALGFSNGFEPKVKMNPYARLLPMLAGIGSPGTISRVLKGYTGDRGAATEWIGSSMTIVDQAKFDIFGKPGGTRPLELATLRLQNMIQILTKWPKLAPENSELITQQGGTLVFEGKDVIYEYKDKGILVYTDILDMLRAIGARVD